MFAADEHVLIYNSLVNIECSCGSYSTCHYSQGTQQTGNAGAHPPQASGLCTPACTCQTWSGHPGALLSAGMPCNLRCVPLSSQRWGHLHAACSRSCVGLQKPSAELFCQMTACVLRSPAYTMTAQQALIMSGLWVQGCSRDPPALT